MSKDEVERLERKLDAVLCIALILAYSRKPRRRTIGDRLWDLI